MTRPLALIIDDERLARKELASLLEKHPEITIVGEAANADEAEKLVAEKRPDLIFLDINMPGMSGFQWLSACESAGILPNGHSSVVIFVVNQRFFPFFIAISVGIIK